MPIEVDWLTDEKNTLVYRIVSPLTNIEVIDGLKESSAMRDGEMCTSVIFDLTECNNVPTNILSSISTMKQHTTKTVDLRIIVGGTLLVTRFFNVIVSVIPNMKKTVRTVATMDEALAILKEKQV